MRFRPPLPFISLAFTFIFPAFAMADTWSTSTTAGNPIRTSTTTTRVGIGITGTNTVRNMLDVEGAAVIGSSYSGTNTAPANGLLVQGFVGVGNTSPQRNLDVTGSLRATSVEGNGVFPITAFGAIPNNITTAYDTQFENALAAAAATGGTVLIPPGQFTFNNQHVIPAGVTVKGAWEGPHDGVLTRGTTIRTTWGSGTNVGTPFLTLSLNSALVGVSIYYPTQSPSNPIPFSWTISGTSSGSVIDVTLVNSFRGIEFQGHHVRHFIKNVNMTALRSGVAVDRATDIGRLENVHIHNDFWMTSGTISAAQFEDLRVFTFANLEGFRFGRVDWEMVTGCFVIFARIGFLFPLGGDITGIPHQDAGILMTNSGSDEATFPLSIEHSQGVNGLQFENCIFVGNSIIQASNEGPVKFTNCNFIQPGGVQDILIEKSGGSFLSLNTCSFWHFRQQDAGRGRGSIDILGGTAQIVNCDFTEPTPHITAIRARAGASVNVVNGVFRGNGILNEGGNMNVSGAILEGTYIDEKTGITNSSGNLNVANVLRGNPQNPVPITNFNGTMLTVNILPPLSP